MRAILPVTAAVPIFAPYAGRRVSLVHSPHTGNAGDRMIERAAEQLCRAFSIQYRVCEPEEAGGDDDFVFLFGGGNYGHRACREERRRRAVALNSGCPCVLLPQTCYGTEHGHYDRAFVRDPQSAKHVPGAHIAPDLAMMYAPQFPRPNVDRERGEFFTRSPEGLFRERGTDPADDFATPEAYITHVGSHATIHTDRIHAAIIGLLCNRPVTLYPTALHKQASMWETWLRFLGCNWAGQ